MANLIPSVIDGLNEYERLALFWALELYADGEGVDVRELTMSTHRSTQTGCVDVREESIIRLAENFVGTNNINLFEPVGDFGDRYKGPLAIGAITTGLEIIVNPITRRIFTEDDDAVAMKELEGCSSCGKAPSWLLPIIPFILVNGCDGNGPWLKSFIPKYKLQDIIANLRLYLAEKEMVPMLPWFRGFTGKVEPSPTDNTHYIISGVIAKIDKINKAVTITELPIGLWMHDYKTWLDGKQWVKSVKDLCESKATIHLEVTLSYDVWQADEEYLMKTLQLIRTISFSDMHAINPRGEVSRYESPLEIIMEFADSRSYYYRRRKDVLLSNMKSELMSADSDIQHSIPIAGRSSNMIKHWMSKLKESPETVKLSKLLGSLHEKIEALDEVDPVVRELEHEVASTFETAVTLWESQRTCGKKRLSEDDILALETICNALNKIKVVVSEVTELCMKRDDLRNELDQLQREDGLSLWLNDLDDLELFLKLQRKKYEKGESGDTAFSVQSSRGWKSKAEFCR